MAEVIKTIVDVEINTGQASAQLKALQQQINAFNLAINKNNSFQTNSTKKYATELKDLINSSKFFTAEVLSMRTSAGALDSTLKKGSATLGQFFSAKFNKNSALFAETIGLASERSKVLQTQFVAISGASKGMQEALAIRPLAAFNSEMSVASQRSQILTAMFKQGTTQLINFGKNVQWAGRQLMVGFTVPLTIFGTTAGKIFRDLEKEAVNFRKVYGDIFTTDFEVEKSLQNVKELASEFTKYGVAVKDTLELAAIGAQAGKTGNELLAATTQATRLAVLGDMDKQDAMRTTIALQSAFRLSNESLASSIDFLNMVENSSVLSLQDLAESIPRVAPVIVGLGGNVKEMAVFLAAMREGGVGAAEAANGLKSSLGRLISPTKQAKEMAADFGISLEKVVTENEGNLLGMIITLSKAMEQLTDLQKQQLLSAVFGKFQFARMGALFENITREGSNAQRIIEMMDMSIEDMAKTADKELGAIEDSIGTQLTGAIERFKLAVAPIGELFVQLAIPIVNFFTQIIEKFNKMPDVQKRFAAIATVIVGLVIPAGTMFIGLLMNLSGTLAKLMQGIGLFVRGMVSPAGVVGGIKAVTQSTKYMSLEEIDAALAARQLGDATLSVNDALRKQVLASQGAQAAVTDLANVYTYLISRMKEAAALSPATLSASSTAMGVAASRQIKGASPRLKFARGGVVPGSGNQDTVPAMLMPGEFVVRKSAVSSVGKSFLQNLNEGGTAKFEGGGDAISTYLAQKEESGRSSSSAGPIASTPSYIVPTTGLPQFSQRILRSAYVNALSNMGFQETQIKDLLDEAARRHPEGKGTVRVAELRKILKDSFNIDKDTLDKQVRTNSRTEKAHITKPKMVKYGSIAGQYESRYKETLPTPPSDLYVDTLSNKVIDIDSELQRNMSPNKSGTLGSVLSADIKKRGLGMFSTMDKQFETWIKDQPASKHRILRQRYLVAKQKSFNSYLDILNDPKNKNSLLKDEDFFRISNRSTRFFGRGELNGFDRSLLERTNVRINKAGIKKSMVAANLPTKGTRLDMLRTLLKKIGSSRSAFAKAIGPNSVIGKTYGLPRNKMSFFKYNKGGAVPSLLTPGEFVVGRDAAQKNRGFLEALNSGNVRKFQEGGSTLGGKILRAGSAAALPLTLGGAALQMSSNEAAKKVGMIAMQAGTVIFGLNMLGSALKSASNIGMIGRMTPLLMHPITGVVAAIAALGVGVAITAKKIEEVRNAGAKLTDAMNGSAEQISRFGEAFGTQSVTEKRISEATQAATGLVSPESQQAASQFMESDAGKELLEDIKRVRKEGQDSIIALRNQLNRAILAGVITEDDAKAIAIEVGTALNDQQLSIQTSAQIISITDENGNILPENILQIKAQLTPVLDTKGIRASAESTYNAQATGFQKIRDRLFGPQAAEQDIQSIERLKIEKEVAGALDATALAVENLRLAQQRGDISILEYREKLKGLGVDAQTTVATGMELLGVKIEDLQKKAGKNGSIFDLSETSKYLTKSEQAAVKMLKSLKNEVSGLFDSILGEGAGNTITDFIIENITGGDAVAAGKIFAELMTGTLDKQTQEKIIKGLVDAYPQLRFILNSLLGETFATWGNWFSAGSGDKGAPVTPPPTPDVTPPETPPDGSKAKSRIEQIRESLRDTKAYADAVRTLANEKNKEAIASIGTGFAELKSNKERKEAIRLVQEQINLEKILSFATQTKKQQEITLLNFRTKSIDIQINGVQKEIDSIKRLSELDQRRIAIIQRANEMDQRQIELRNRALNEIAKKEKDLNKLYDEKMSALDRVASANDRIANQEKGRLDLASALTSGDISAAAAAANAINQSFAQSQIQDVRAQLEVQRQREIDALTGSVNDQLFTRQELELQIEQINERIYQNNLNIRDIQDQIYERELALIPLEDQIYQLNLQRESTLQRINLLQLEIEQSEYQKMLQVAETTKGFKEQRKVLRDIVSSLEDAIARQKELNRVERFKLFAFGGAVKMAMGGKVGYKGSTERPPVAMMGGGKVKKYAVGNVVPGLGNTDRVPALLTPGEFVVRKSVAKQNMSLLKSLNGDVFPQINTNLKEVDTKSITPITSVQNNQNLYNSYNLSVNVAGTNASPDEIANVVISKIRRIEDRNIRGRRY